MSSNLPYKHPLREIIKRKAYAEAYGKPREPWYWYLWSVPMLALLGALVAIRVIWDYYRKSWLS